MKICKRLLGGILIVLCSNILTANAKESTLKLQDIELPNAEQQSCQEITFPAIPRISGKVPVLKARIFFQSPATSGWNNCSSIVFNGKQLGRYTASGNERLLRRGEAMKLASENRAWWDEGNGLLVMFGPGEGELDKRILAPREEGYWYFFDVEDMIYCIEPGLDGRIESARSNTIVFYNGLTTRLIGSEPRPLAVKNLEIIFLTPGELAKLRSQPQTLTIEPSPVKTVMTQQDSEISITETGGLILKKHGETFFWSAAFSYPAVSVMGFDPLSPDFQNCRSNWQPVIVQDEKSGTVTVTAATDDRQIQRTLHCNGEFLEIEDAVTNLSDNEVGMESRYRLISEAALPASSVFLAGMQGVNQESGCGANPTVYLQGTHSGIGFMALEAALRCHLELSKTASNCVELRNPTALAPGETYRQKYLLMLTDAGDYFAFVNAVRKHLHLNRTIEGPLAIGVQHIDSKHQVNVTTESSWFEYGSIQSLELSREAYFEQYQAKLPQYRKQNPAVKLLPMMEMTPRTLDKRKLPHGVLLPDSQKALTGTYGQTVSKEATEVIEKETPFGDSILRTADGLAIIDTFYPEEPELSLLVYPYQNNAHWKHLQDQADFLLNRVQTDGIYIDQFAPGSMNGLSKARDRFTFDRWDGRTVELNADGTIKRKLFDIALACADIRIAFIRNVLDKGKILLANTQPVTTEEADAGGYRFYESDSENLAPMLSSTGKPGTYRMQTLSQLSPSPLILGTRPGIFDKERKHWARMYNRAFIAALRHGILYCHYGMSTGDDCYGLINHMFPITPVELGEGFIIGKERILSAVSREFVTSQKPRRIFFFDAEGREMPDTAKIQSLPDGKWKISVKLNDWNASCAIEF